MKNHGVNINVYLVSKKMSNSFLLFIKLCTVTLSLFETLVGLNCEDVMLWLVFRHLIPMQHLIPSQRPSIKQPDLHGRGAERYDG